MFCLAWEIVYSENLNIDIIIPDQKNDDEVVDPARLQMECYDSTFDLRVELDFVCRNEDHNHDNDDGRLLQLTRPMPNILRDYVTNHYYENVCIPKIDPLLETLYEVEKSCIRRMICILIISHGLFATADFSFNSL